MYKEAKVLFLGRCRARQAIGNQRCWMKVVVRYAWRRGKERVSGSVSLTYGAVWGGGRLERAWM